MDVGLTFHGCIIVSYHNPQKNSATNDVQQTDESTTQIFGRKFQ